MGRGLPDSIQVIHVDDEPDFAEVAAKFIERQDEGLNVEPTTSPAEALDRIQTEEIHCVVSDYEMPEQSGIEFLETVREEFPDLPFILYTGKGSEEVASDAISAGVTDYLQKGTGSSQYEVLANRIRNAVDSFHTERALQATRQRYEKLVEQSLAGIYIIQDGEFVYVNPKLAENHGYEQDELIGMTPMELTAPKERDRVREYIQKRLDGEVEEIQYETVGLTKDGEHIDIQLHGSRIQYQGKPALIGMEIDITERKEHERELETTLEFLKQLYEVATNAELNSQETISRLLQAGQENLGLPYGHLTRIEYADEISGEGTQTVIEASGDHELLQPDDTSPLSSTYCRQTIETGGVFEVNDARTDGWESDPAYELFDLGSYIGTTVHVQDELFGTLFFASTTPRDEPFSDAERTFVRFMSRLVSYELEQESQS